MLRAMLLIVLAIILLVIVATQVILPMITDKLDFFWFFRKGDKDADICSSRTREESLSKQAHAASQQYKNAKREIKQRREKLEKLDKETDV